MKTQRTNSVLAACLVAGLLAVGPTVAAETVPVNLADDAGPALYRASGFLHGFRADATRPPDEAVRPLKIQLHRTRPSATWSQAARMKALGITQQVVISDGWGYGREHPGDDGNWTKWETFVVFMVQGAAKRGLRVQWDIWNEPDHSFFWKRSPEQFNETWRRAYLKIRQTDPTAVIIGPSWSGVHPGDPRFGQFLLYCKQQNVMPDYVCWHFPRDIVKETRICREFLKANGIRVRGLMVNEYCLKHEQYAGRTAWLIAQIERAGLDATCHAIWSDEGKGNLDGILHDPAKGIPRGQWWAYRRYADITGRLVRTEPSPRIDLVAGKDPQARTARVLLGNAGGATGDVTVRFTGIDKAPYLVADGRVHVVAERIPEADGGPVTELPVVFEKDLPVEDGAVEATISWTSDRDAYAVRLGLPSSP